MFEKDIEIIKKNIGRKVEVRYGKTRNCEVIGYCVDNRPVGDYKMLRVLLHDTALVHTERSWEWKDELDKYIILVNKEMNPDDFVAVPFNLIRTDVNNYFISAY